VLQIKWRTKLDKISKRIEKVRKTFDENQIDGILIFIEENRFYLSGFEGEDSQFDETAGILAIGKEKLILATDSRFTTEAEANCPLYEIYCYKKGLSKEITNILEAAQIKKAGFESVRVSVDWFDKMNASIKESKKNLSLKPVSGIVEKLRLIKDEDEINTIETALEISEKGLLKIKKDLKPGITEAKAAWMLEKALKEKGIKELSFSTITATGKNSAKPHAIPSKTILESKGHILFDWGIILDRYCSDITRTFFIEEMDSKFEEIFNIVRKAQIAGTNAIRAGIKAKEVDFAARKVIEEAGYGKYFGHGLGHGVGMAVHEAPRLSPLTDEILEEGMVVTVEPGIYLPDWGGIRLENMVVVQKDGAKTLNTTKPEDFLI
jgi:Xaa-Pro aminopeptidase